MLALTAGWCTAVSLAQHRWAPVMHRIAPSGIRMVDSDFSPQVDPAASAAFAICAGGFTWLQLKVGASEKARESRDAAEDAARAMEASVLAGSGSIDQLEALRRDAEDARTAFEEARAVKLLGMNLPLRVPDPRQSRRRREAEAAVERRAGGAPSQEGLEPPPLVPAPVRNGAIGLVRCKVSNRREHGPVWGLLPLQRPRAFSAHAACNPPTSGPGRPARRYLCCSLPCWLCCLKTRLGRPHQALGKS